MGCIGTKARYHQRGEWWVVRERILQKERMGNGRRVNLRNGKMYYYPLHSMCTL